MLCKNYSLRALSFCSFCLVQKRGGFCFFFFSSTGQYVSVALGLWKLQISAVRVAAWLLGVIPACCPAAAFPEGLPGGSGCPRALHTASRYVCASGGSVVGCRHRVMRFHLLTSSNQQNVSEKHSSTTRLRHQMHKNLH